ncbi:MAG: DUF2911 domain-containing protein [Bacteroidota bacterium]
MNRILSLLLIALMAFVGFACTETKQATAEEETVSTETMAAETASDVAFEVNVLNDSIPSPRKEMQATIDGVSVTVNYGSPSVKGRTIFGDLVPYDQVWRTGANEATILTVSKDATINGQALPAGTYGFFTIPGESDWTLIFNKVSEQWGAYQYDEGEDQMRVKVTPMAAEATSETLEFGVEEGKVVMMWSDLKVPFPVMGG